MARQQVPLSQWLACRVDWWMHGDITFTGSVRTDTEREAAQVMVAELTGVRRVRHDIQIRELEQA